jgi:hypothetical protein
MTSLDKAFATRALDSAGLIGWNGLFEDVTFIEVVDVIFFAIRREFPGLAVKTVQTESDRLARLVKQ